MWESRLSGSVRGWGTTDVWSRYCGTTGKPGGNRENKHRPAASGVPSLLDKNSCGVSVGVFLQPVSSIHSSPLKNLRFVDTASLDEYFDHAGTGSWEDARKCLFLLVGRTGIEPVIR